MDVCMDAVNFNTFIKPTQIFFEKNNISVKKTLAVALVVFCCLSSYLINQYYLRIKKIKNEKEKIQMVNNLIPFRRDSNKLDDLIDSDALIPRENHGADQSLFFRSQKIHLEKMIEHLLIYLSKMLNMRDIIILSQVDHFFNKLSKHQTLEKFLLEESNTYLFNRLEMAERVGKSLFKLNLSGSNLSDRDLEELFLACPNIKEINLSNCTRLTSRAIQYLPAGLLSLDLSMNDWLKVEDIKRLPRGLRALNLYYCELLNIFKEETAKELPPGLQFLNLNAGTEHTTHLESNEYEHIDMAPLSDVMIENLPRTLTSFSCRELMEKAVRKLPSNLIFLEISDCTFLMDESIAQLPRGLKSLQLWVCDDLTNAAIKNLPPHLVFLELHNLSITDIDDFPSELETLHLSSCPSLVRIRNLPSNLKDFKSSFNCALEKIENFPKNLISMNLFYCNELRCIDNFPKNLETLNLAGCSKLTVDIPTLPQKLTSLNLREVKLTSEIIKILPKHLSFLDLSESSITKIKYFPEHLKDLNLVNCRLLTLDTKKLPRNLKYVDLSSINLKNSTLENLPPNLEFLKLCLCSNLTNLVIHSNLIEVDVSDCSNLKEVKNFSRKLKSIDLTHCNELRNLDKLIGNIPIVCKIVM